MVAFERVVVVTSKRRLVRVSGKTWASSAASCILIKEFEFAEGSVQLCCRTWRPRESSFASCTSFGSRWWRAKGAAACRALKAATPLLLDQAASRTSFAESMSPKLLVVPSGCPSTRPSRVTRTARHPCCPVPWHRAAPRHDRRNRSYDPDQCSPSSPLPRASPLARLPVA